MNWAYASRRALGGSVTHGRYNRGIAVVLLMSGLAIISEDKSAFTQQLFEVPSISRFVKSITDSLPQQEKKTCSQSSAVLTAAPVMLTLRTGMPTDQVENPTNKPKLGHVGMHCHGIENALAVNHGRIPRDRNKCNCSDHYQKEDECSDQVLSKGKNNADAKVSVQNIPTVAALLLVLRSVPRALFASLVAVCAAEPAPQPAQDLFQLKPDSPFRLPELQETNGSRRRQQSSCCRDACDATQPTAAHSPRRLI